MIKDKSVLPTTSLIRKYILKDLTYLVRVLKQTQNFETFLENLIWLLAMRVGKFFEEYNLTYFDILKDKLLSKLEALVNKDKSEIDKILYTTLGDDESVEEVRELLLSEDFRNNF